MHLGGARIITELLDKFFIGEIRQRGIEKDKVWLMGHSEGGMQIMHYACKHPDRVAGMVVLARELARLAGRTATS